MNILLIRKIIKYLGIMDREKKMSNVLFTMIINNTTTRGDNRH